VDRLGEGYVLPSRAQHCEAGKRGEVPLPGVEDLQAVLLQVRLDVGLREPGNLHDVEDGHRLGMLDAQRLDGALKLTVKFVGPDAPVLALRADLVDLGGVVLDGRERFVVGRGARSR